MRHWTSKRAAALLVLALALCVPLAIAAYVYPTQRRAIEWTLARNGQLAYQCEFVSHSEDYRNWEVHWEERAPWLIKLGLAPYLSKVRFIYLGVDDAHPITDADLEVLRQVPWLRYINILHRGELTPAEKARIRNALPHVRVVFERPPRPWRGDDQESL